MQRVGVKSRPSTVKVDLSSGCVTCVGNALAARRSDIRHDAQRNTLLRAQRYGTRMNQVEGTPMHIVSENQKLTISKEEKNK